MKKLSKYAVVLATACVASPQAKATNLLGIDVGSGVNNWATVKSNGVAFVFVSATEGNYFENSNFKNYMTGGKAAGLQMGAAHFARPGLDTPAVEANYFWNFAGPYILADGKSISPAVEFSEFSGHVGTSNYTAWFNDWAADVEAKTTNSMKPVIYTSACTGACDLIEFDKSGGIKLGAWIADYNGESVYTGEPWTSCDCCNAWVTGCGTGNWTYWQATDTGMIPGITGDVDLDAYNGTLAQLKSEEGVGGK